MATSGADNGLHGGTAGILTDPRQFGAGPNPSGAVQQKGEVPEDPKEEPLVRKRWKEFERGRKFDENYRKQVAIDRRYAAGTSDLSWAVTTNLIGAFIDILVALLYARNPDVSVKKAAQVDESNTRQMELFAETLQIVISSLWKNGNLKKAARKAVRSVLSTAEGWLKVNLLSEKEPQPETDKALNDAQETVARLEAQLKLMEDPQDKDPETIQLEIDEKKELIDELEKKLEVSVRKFLAIDFVRSERIQVSLDVESIEDYKEADWIADESYVLEEDALERFPRLSTEDIKVAKKFFQNEPKELTTRELDNVLPQGTITAESSQAFSSSTSQGQDASPFLRVVEMWDRRDKHIYTLIDGVKKWAKEPYTPPYPTKRFYPYFYFAFYEVDGQRHAQSLSWRLYKLQDEYSTTRSNYRLTRERSIAGTMFNATQLDNSEMKKITEAKHQEFIPVRPGNPDTPMTNLFAPKPVAPIDMRVFETTEILNDMERISGVQEALSSAINGPGNPRTATEANIQQAGTNARTISNRDYLEEMLNDLAEATAQQALQGVTKLEAMRIAGNRAFWPGPDEDGKGGMSVEDLFTLVEVAIQAGSTGKPEAPGDQQTWTTVLPILREMIAEIRQQLAQGDLPSAQANIELLKTTMKRLGEEADPERFIPRVPPPGSPGAGAPPAPVMPKVQVALKADLDPFIASQLVAPALRVDQLSAPPPTAGAPPGATANAPPVAAPMPAGGGVPPQGPAQ